MTSPRQLMALNVVFAAVSAICIAFIVRQLLVPLRVPTSRPRPVTAVAAPPPQIARLDPGAYGIVTARNLFSPTRTEAPQTGMAGGPSLAVKLNLFGVVLREGAPIAYLEDPATKRVAGYRVGDSIGGGTISSITGDNVVVTRPDGRMEVRLHDPSRPRPAAPPTAGMPGQPSTGAPTPVPGTQPPGTTQALPPGPIVPVIPGVPPAAGQPQPGAIPGRRPLPPNLLRRIPPTAPSDAPQR